MTVKIDLELKAGDVKSEIELIRDQLKSLDEEDFDFGLDLDIGDQLDDIENQFDDIGTKFKKDINTGMDRLEDIEGIDTSGINLGTGGDSGGDTGSDSGDDSGGRSWRRVHSIAKDYGYWDNNFKKVADRIQSEDSGRRLLNRPGNTGLFRNPLKGDGDPFMSKGGTGFKYDKSLFPNVDFDKPSRGPQVLEKFKKLGDREGPNPFKKAIPSMRIWYRMLGAIIPMLGAMIVQAAGVAVAMGGVAVAGASLIGLGLVGHGEDMEESWANAKEQLSELKKELFQAAQPAAQAFAPISEEFLSWAPSQVEKLSHELKGLTAFENITFDMFRGVTDWLGDMAQGLIENQDAVTQLSRRFGNLIGQAVLDLFQWLTEQAAANQDMLVQLGSAFVKLGGVLYQVFMVVSRFVIALTPLFTVFTMIGKILNNKIIGSILVMASVMGVAMYAAMALGSAFLALGQISLAGLFPQLAALKGMLDSYTLSAIAGQIASLQLAEALSVVATVGTAGLAIPLALWSGKKAFDGIQRANKMKKEMGSNSMGSVGSSTGTGAPSVYNGGNTYIDVEGDMDGPAADKIADIHGKEDGITQIRDGKSPGPGNRSV